MLNPNIQNLELGINKIRNFDKLKVKQYDKNLRELKFIFIEDSEIVSIPNDYIAKIQVTLPSKETFMDDCEPITDGMTVIYKPNDLFTSVSGTIFAEIGFYKAGETSADDGLIQSSTFEIEVEKSAMDRNAIISSPQFNTLTIMINTLTGLVESAEQTIVEITEAIVESSTATTLANTAATNANEKANLANTATTNANIATTNANNAATLANTKAELADTKAQQAQAIVDSASPIINTNLQASYADKATLTGQSLNFTTADNGLIEITNIDGKSNQLTTTQGKNLFPKFTNQTVSGVVMTVATDGTITLNGSVIGGGNIFFNIPYNKLLPAGTYTLSANNPVINSEVHLRLSTSVDGALYQGVSSILNGINKATTYTLVDGTPMYFTLRIGTGQTFTNFIIKPQLEAGSTATTYEPFTPNSPSVDYPAPITPFDALGTAKARAVGKNYCPKFMNQTIAGITIVVDEDGTMHLSGTATANIVTNIKVFTNIPQGTYRTSANNPVANSGVLIRLFKSSEIYSDMILDGINRSITQTISFVAEQIHIRISNGTVLTNFIIKPQLELGSTATPYEPHLSNEAPITFSGYSLPNLVKDTMDMQRCGNIVLNGSENWVLIENSSGYLRFYYQSSLIKAGSINLMSNKFPTRLVSDTPSYMTYENIHNNINNPRFGIVILSSRLATQDVTGFKSWLASNPVTVIYELATYIPKTPDRIFLTSYKPITNVSILDTVQTEFTGAAKSELWSNDYLIKLNSINTDKIAQSDVINDSSKVASSVVTHSHGQRLNAIESDVGDLSELNTTSNTDLVGAINELSTDKLDKTGESSDNTVNFTENSTDSDIITGENHSDLFGKILKSIKTFRNAINEINAKFKNNKTTSNNVLYKVTDQTDVDSALSNALTNSTFYHFPMGVSTTVNTNEDKYVCGNWRVKTIDASCTATKINSINGGVNLNSVFGVSLSWVYLRQLIPVITQFSKKTYTFTADIEVDVAVDADLYVEARINTNDLERVLVVDTENVSLSIGRQRIACTFTVPDIDSLLSAVDIKNSLELALRFNGSNKTVNIKVYECVLTEGNEIKTNFIPNIPLEQKSIELFYETGSTQMVGFTSTSGQKRITTTFRTKKIQQPAVTVSDLAGNIGKISTYDSTGTRTDNVDYTALSITQDYIIVIVNASIASGIAYNYVANSYF